MIQFNKSRITKEDLAETCKHADFIQKMIWELCEDIVQRYFYFHLLSFMHWIITITYQTYISVTIYIYKYIKKKLYIYIYIYIYNINIEIYICIYI